jgi:hypothetical protein
MSPRRLEPQRVHPHDPRAFSSEVGTGSREENASNKNPEPGLNQNLAPEKSGGLKKAAASDVKRR